MLDRIDRTGQFLDGAGERGGEVVDEPRGGPNLARILLVGLERLGRQRVAQQTRKANRCGGLEVSVVRTGAERVEEPLRHRHDLPAHAAQHLVARDTGCDGVLDHLTRLA